MYFSLVAALSLFILISTKVYSQPQSDLTAIVQKCVDLPELQPHFPANPNGSMKAVHVMQRDVSLPPDLGVTKFGQPLIVMHRGQIHGNLIDTYLMFHKLEISGNQANVIFGFTYGSLDSPKSMTVTLTMHKNGEKWSITNSIIEQ